MPATGVPPGPPPRGRPRTPPAAVARGWWESERAGGGQTRASRPRRGTWTRHDSPETRRTVPKVPGPRPRSVAVPPRQNGDGARAATRHRPTGCRAPRHSDGGRGIGTSAAAGPRPPLPVSRTDKIHGPSPGMAATSDPAAARSPANAPARRCGPAALPPVQPWANSDNSAKTA